MPPSSLLPGCTYIVSRSYLYTVRLSRGDRGRGSGSVMTSKAATEAIPSSRVPLSRERVLRSAIALADSGGIEALTMRRLGQALGVEAMSLYNHVANKDDILNGILGLVDDEIA